MPTVLTIVGPVGDASHLFQDNLSQRAQVGRRELTLLDGQQHVAGLAQGGVCVLDDHQGAAHQGGVQCGRRRRPPRRRARQGRRAPALPGSARASRGSLGIASRVPSSMPGSALGYVSSQNWVATSCIASASAPEASRMMTPAGRCSAGLPCGPVMTPSCRNDHRSGRSTIWTTSPWHANLRNRCDKVNHPATVPDCAPDVVQMALRVIDRPLRRWRQADTMTGPSTGWSMPVDACQGENWACPPGRCRNTTTSRATVRARWALSVRASPPIRPMRTGWLSCTATTSSPTGATSSPETSDSGSGPTKRSSPTLSGWDLVYALPTATGKRAVHRW